jgi:hypothetical protein
MRGVDVFAQRQSYNKIGRRSRKWFYSLLWYLVDIAIHNAFILYQLKHQKQHCDEKAFRKELMQLLVNDFCARKKAAAAPKRRRNSLHPLERSDDERDCSSCRPRLASGQHGRQTHFRCADCDVFLCMPDCYNRHIQELTKESADIEDE